MTTGSIQHIVKKIFSIADSNRSSMRISEIFEMIMYLIILKYLDYIDESSNKRDLSIKEWLMGDESIFSFQAERYKWQHWIDKSDQDRYDFLTKSVFPYLNSLEGNYMIHKFLQGLDIQDISSRQLNSFIEVIDEIKFNELNKYRKSDLANSLLDVFIVNDPSNLGQFVTPEPLRYLMVHLFPNLSNGRILDPACGTGLLLTDYSKLLSENPDSSLKIQGIDISRRMMNFARFNFIMSEVGNSEVFRADSLSESDTKRLPNLIGEYDRVVSHPPFGLRYNPKEIRSDLDLQSNKGDLLFLKLAMKALKSTGVACITLSPNIFFASDNATRKMRMEIVESYTPQLIVELPKGVFKPYAGVAGYITLIKKVEKRPHQNDKVLFYDLSNVENYENHINEIIEWWNNDRYIDNEITFSVPIQKIRDNDYILTINRYKSTNIDDSLSLSKEEILKNLLDKEEEILNRLLNLRDSMKNL